MSAKRRSNSKPPAAREAQAPALRVRRLREGDGWELVHPPCAALRAEDLEEVEAMLDEGELEIAAEELRWLLEGCHNFIAAHYKLGLIAMSDQDWALARGHCGYAWELGRQALKLAGVSGPTPYASPANANFLESGKALAACLRQLGEARPAIEVLEELLVLDPSDPLDCRSFLNQVRRGPSLPVIQPPPTDDPAE